MINGVGFFKLHRELFNKPIWLNSTPEQKTILITLLAMVNFKENDWEWKGKKYKTKAGQKITSVASIKKACGNGVSPQNIKTALKRFENLEFLTNESTNEGRLITITNWELYQVNENNQPTNQPMPNQRLTDASPTPNQRLTTKEERKKVGECQEGNKDIKTIVEYLNEKSNSNFRYQTKTTQSKLKAILKIYSVEDIKKVINIKCAEWIGTEYEKYLRPETVFGTKFESYLNQKEGKTISKKNGFHNFKEGDGMNGMSEKEFEQHLKEINGLE